MGEQGPKRVARLADLEEAAYLLRQTLLEYIQQGYPIEPVYLYAGEAGVIRQSKREPPPDVDQYVVLGQKGRIWSIVSR